MRLASLCASDNQIICSNERFIRCRFLRGTGIKSFLLIESHYQFVWYNQKQQSAESVIVFLCTNFSLYCRYSTRLALRLFLLCCTTVEQLIVREWRQNMENAPPCCLVFCFIFFQSHTVNGSIPCDRLPVQRRWINIAKINQMT